MSDNRLLALFQQILSGGSSETPLLASEVERRLIATGITIDINGLITFTQPLAFPGTSLTNIANANIAAGAAIDWSKINKTGSNLTDLTTRALAGLTDYVEWTTVAYASGNFTGSGSMTWTVDSGDQAAFRYRVVGKTMTVFFDIRTTTVAGTPSTSLQIAIPGGYALANDNESFQMIRIFDNGTPAIGYAAVRNTGAGIQLQRTIDGSTNWSAATNTTSVQGTVDFQVA
jgi:hypothetical protein